MPRTVVFLRGILRVPKVQEVDHNKSYDRSQTRGNNACYASHGFSHRVNFTPTATTNIDENAWLDTGN